MTMEKKICTITGCGGVITVDRKNYYLIKGIGMSYACSKCGILYYPGKGPLTKQNIIFYKGTYKLIGAGYSVYWVENGKRHELRNVNGEYTP